MRSTDLLRLVDQMHHDKNIKRDVIFDGIEAALQLAAQKHFGEESAVAVSIDRNTGQITVQRGEEIIDPALLGRIPAQSAKNVMIQKIREAESTSVFNEFTAMKGDLVSGFVQRHESGASIIAISRTEALLPRSEQIPGESFHINDRVKAVITDVRKSGQRVKIILSRSHSDFVRRLFEEEIPEIGEERIIDIKAIAREAGYRTKIAVSSIDSKVDCVGACVGVRGSRIKNIVDELNGERIDIVRWNDSLQVMIPNALQPAEIEEVFLYHRPGRAIVLVKEDQLSLAIGRRGQNVRLASKLVGWDIEIMTHEELNESIEKAVNWFNAIPGIADEMVEAFIEEGFMSFDDLSLCDPADLVEIAGMDETLAEEVVDFAEQVSEKLERGEELDFLMPPPEEKTDDGEEEQDSETETDEMAAEDTAEGEEELLEESDQIADEQQESGSWDTSSNGKEDLLESSSTDQEMETSGEAQVGLEEEDEPESDVPVPEDEEEAAPSEEKP